MLFLNDITYMHPSRDVLFTGINLTVNKHDKIALIGNNGVGKSTLLKIASGILKPSDGTIKRTEKPYYIPQLYGQFNTLTVAEALGIAAKLDALHEILSGNVSDGNFEDLEDDWTIENRCNEAFSYWQLNGIDLQQSMSGLSGGQKTRVFLAGIFIHNPQVVLLDEPSNHLDASSRVLLYDYIKTTAHTLVVVSHDRKLLNLLSTTCELTNKGSTVYGGNYDFYMEQKSIENEALVNDVKSKEKALRKAKEIERESAERQQKLDARGKKKQEKAGLPTIAMKTLKNNAEKSTSKLKGIHAEKISAISGKLSELRNDLPDMDKMKLNLDSSSIHTGKILVTANAINFSYNDSMLWQNPLSFTISSGERIAVKGNNGSGKTTLIHLILGKLQPSVGVIERAEIKWLYIDQDYSLINNTLSVYQQAWQFNTDGLQEHDIKMRLSRFLFTQDYWDKPCNVLSGGEKMRLMLCSLTISNQAPDMIILDEPNNNIDLQNIAILTAAVNEYKGTLVVISHDAYFLKQVNISRTIDL